MKLNNLCSFCTNIGCEFQSGIVRTKCAFYIPPHAESISKDQNARTVDVLDKIRDELYLLHYHPKLDYIKNDEVVDMALDIIDKNREEQTDAT